MFKEQLAVTQSQETQLPVVSIPTEVGFVKKKRPGYSRRYNPQGGFGGLFYARSRGFSWRADSWERLLSGVLFVLWRGDASGFYGDVVLRALRGLP